jgi:hypothetical protein
MVALEGSDGFLILAQDAQGDTQDACAPHF